MTSHSRLNQRRNVNCLSSRFFDRFDYHCECCRLAVVVGSYAVVGFGFVMSHYGAAVAVDLKTLSCKIQFNYSHGKHSPCGIGGDFAERGLEFGVERGDCV